MKKASSIYKGTTHSTEHALGSQGRDTNDKIRGETRLRLRQSHHYNSFALVAFQETGRRTEELCPSELLFMNGPSRFARA